jgi:hypothetical protein
MLPTWVDQVVALILSRWEAKPSLLTISLCRRRSSASRAKCHRRAIVSSAIEPLSSCASGLPSTHVHRFAAASATGSSPMTAANGHRLDQTSLPWVPPSLHSACRPHPDAYDHPSGLPPMSSSALIAVAMEKPLRWAPPFPQSLNGFPTLLCHSSRRPHHLTASHGRIWPAPPPHYGSPAPLFAWAASP